MFLACTSWLPALAVIGVYDMLDLSNRGAERES